MTNAVKLKFDSEGNASIDDSKVKEQIVECIGVPCELAVSFNNQTICAAVQKNVWSVYRQDHACPRRRWYRDTKTGISTMKSWVGKCEGECDWPGGKARHGQDPVDGHRNNRAYRH